MDIVERIKDGKLKGWTIRKSKHGWHDLYSKEGLSQTKGKNSLEDIENLIKQLK